MERECVNPAELPAANSTYSQAIRASGFVFVAGQIGIDRASGQLISDDIAEQTRVALDNAATILAAAGSSMAKVVSTTLYLTEFHELKRVNAVYARYFPENGPAKTACGVSELYGGAKIEITLVALA